MGSMLHSSSVRPISREGRLPRGPCAYRYRGTGAGLLISSMGVCEPCAPAPEVSQAPAPPWPAAPLARFKE